LFVISSSHLYSYYNIDRDGTVDYLGVDADGNVQGWRNVGTENTGIPNWEEMRVINSGGTMSNVDGIHFVCYPREIQRPGRKVCYLFACYRLTLMEMVFTHLL
jgi:hypothetical protein